MTTSDTAPDVERGRTGAGDAPSWQLRLRRYGYVARPRPGVTERLEPPYAPPSPRLAALFGFSPDAAGRFARWAAWGGPALVALVAGVLRFWRLGSPHAVIFDETYYAKDAWSLYQHGYEGHWAENANKLILADPQKIPLSDDPSYVVHPPAGKWVIGLGEWLFGLEPFGWRFMTAVLGTLSVFLLCRIGRRLFRSTVLGCLAGALMAVDGLHYVMSRVALLDLVLMFWVLAAFGCLLVDRDKARARLAAALRRDAESEAVRHSTDAPSDSVRHSADAPSGHAPSEAGPDAPGEEAASGVTPTPDPGIAERLGLGWRPWRLAAGVCLGLACATKWNGLYILAAFGVLTVLWDMGARRTAGAGRPFLAMLRRDALPGFASLVPVALVTYVATWSGWFATQGGYFRDWAEKEGQAGSWGWLPGPLRSLWHYESEVYDFHVGLTSGHTYESNPWSWLVVGRPVSYFYESPKNGQDGCTAADGCAREVLALGTPLLWWAACFALLYVLYRWLFRRDWRAGAVLCGVAAGYLPWFLYQERTIFYFYAVVFLPFLCLALTMMIGALAGPPGVTERRRLVGVVGSGVLFLLITWNFIYFWPLYTGQAIPTDDWQQRMWLDTWI
nr:phospholipid carrier-dependent glycosyltransferase [Streptomyces armeniacus]